MIRPIKSHMDAHLLFNKRGRGRPAKKISACLELRKTDDDFTVTSRGGSIPILTLTRSDAATIHFAQARSHLGPFSVVSHLRRYFGIYIFHKRNHRVSPQWWYRHGEVDIPLVDNMRIHLGSGAPLDVAAAIERRRIRRDVAKPIRDKIAAWEKLARSYLALEENFKSGMLASYRAEFPKLEDEVTVEGLFKMIRWGAEKGWGYILYSRNTWTSQDPELVRKKAKRAFKVAFEQWKELLYKEHGAFTWVVDKGA